MRLARLVSLDIARLFHVALDAVELVDKSQCHLRSADLALGLSFLMNLRRACPATYTLDAFLGFYAGTAEISGMSRDVMPRIILNNEEQSYSL